MSESIADSVFEKLFHVAEGCKSKPPLKEKTDCAHFYSHYCKGDAGRGVLPLSHEYETLH